MDSRLSRYEPLVLILLVDDFDTGMSGWVTYFHDYDGREDYPGPYGPVVPVKTILDKSLHDPAIRVDRRLPMGPHGVPMLSSLTSWDVGSSGSFQGNYALKIPTPARAGYKAFAQKRITAPWRGRFRVETWFTFKAEPSDFRLGYEEIAALYLTFYTINLPKIREQAEEPVRWWPCLRYHHAEAGKLVQRWQVNLTGSTGVKDGAWTYLDDGYQELGFNRSPTKCQYQWHYLRFTFDLTTHEYVDFHCYGKEFKVEGLKHDPNPAIEGWRASTDKCGGLLNTGFGLEAAIDKRVFLYLDSVVVSASE